MQDDSFRLHLIGRGDLAVPLELQGRVVKEPNLAYPVCAYLIAPPLPPQHSKAHRS